MKRLKRPPPPARLDRKDPERLAKIRQWYAAKPRDHWNDKDHEVAEVPKTLREMSGDRCAWCERALDDNLKVEHYLPRAHFPWLAYHWENLLPTCSRCNGAKHTLYPERLQGRLLIDPALEGHQSGEVYDPTVLLPTVELRLLEPSIDEPREHLRFVPIDCTWAAITPAGEWTARKFLSDKKYNERLQKVSALARDHVRGEISGEAVALMLDLIGHETVFAALTAHWRAHLAVAAGDPSERADPPVVRPGHA